MRIQTYLVLLLFLCIYKCTWFEMSELERVTHLFSSYPISALPEHLHSTLLRYAKTTGKHTKSKETSFHPSLTLVPLLANHPHSHYLPLTGGPPNTHPFLVILCFGAPGDGCAPGSLLLCCVRSARKVTKLPVFSCYLPFVATFMFISFIKRSAILRFFIVLVGGGVMLNLVYGSMFLLRGLCSALCFVCYD